MTCASEDVVTVTLTEEQARAAVRVGDVRWEFARANKCRDYIYPDKPPERARMDHVIGARGEFAVHLWFGLPTAQVWGAGPDPGHDVFLPSGSHLAVRTTGRDPPHLSSPVRQKVKSEMMVCARTVREIEYRVVYLHGWIETEEFLRRATRQPWQYGDSVAMFWPDLRPMAELARREAKTSLWWGEV